MFVLDEADEMLNEGFTEQVYKVFQKVPNDVQVILLSATMPPNVLDVTKKFMRDPIEILIKKEELTLEGIRQFYIDVQKDVSISFFQSKKSVKKRGGGSVKKGKSEIMWCKLVIANFNTLWQYLTYEIWVGSVYPAPGTERARLALYSRL